MNGRAAWLGLLLLLCGLVGTLAAQFPPEPQPTEERYNTLIADLKATLGPSFTVHRVGMFVVAWDLNRDAGDQYEKLIPQVQEALYENFFATRPDDVIRIALFKDNASLRKNAKKLATKSPVMPGGGFYLPYEKVLCVETPMGEWLLKHELTHALLHADFRQRRLCPWFDEGMAMLVESAAINDKKIDLRLDWRLTLVQQQWKAQKLPHLKDVFRMDFATYNSMSNRMIGDAMGRCFLMYLQEKGLLMTFYKRFRGNYSQDPTGIKFLEAITKKKIDALETDWLAWVSEKTPNPAGDKPVPANPPDQ